MYVQNLVRHSGNKVLTMAGLIGIDGNLDVSRLEKDLRNALDFDIKYKQTDNMKKRACKVATDYDEFKNMVACAHLKTLSRKEITSLGTTKKGWLKEGGGKDKTAGTLILSDELNCTAVLTTNPIKILGSGGSIKKPKSPMELDRDLRRCTDNEEKAKYLSAVGVKRVCKLLEVDADLFESLLTVVIHHAQSTMSGKASTADEHGTSATRVTSTETVCSEEDTENIAKDKPAEPTIAAYQWFSSFAAMPRFQFMVRFLTNDLITAVVQHIESSGEPGCADLALLYSGGGSIAS